jgi:hypothetical protein
MPDLLQKGGDSMVSLRGIILQKTDKAVLVHITQDIHVHLRDKDEWFPLSKVKLKELKQQPGYCSLQVPNWLYESKIVVDEKCL